MQSEPRKIIRKFKLSSSDLKTLQTNQPCSEWRNECLISQDSEKLSFYLKAQKQKNYAVVKRQILCTILMLSQIKFSLSLLSFVGILYTFLIPEGNPSTLCM